MTTPEQLTGLIEEIGSLRDAVEELYSLLDHAWKNRGEVYDLLEQHKEISAIQSETREQLLYCCNAPDLRWHGDPDHPGVACLNCEYPVAENGALVTYTPEEAAEVAEKAKQRQRSLFCATESTEDG